MSEGDGEGSSGSEGGGSEGGGSEGGASGPGGGMQYGQVAAGKYFLIEVPNFNLAESEEEAMSSYLRLGAVPNPGIAGKADAPKPTGEDLASKARRKTRIDGVTENIGSAQRSKPFLAMELVFEDDIRERDPSAPITTAQGETLERVVPVEGANNEATAATEAGVPVSLDSPLAALGETRFHETAQLHTKGGWRDHSDGNRITTTRGDKIEIIRGNYKMVVLGRQENLDNAAGWDLSGGEIRDTSQNLGEFEAVSVEWVQDDGGRWRCVEKNQKGDEYSIQWGDSHEEFFGELKEEITGSETPGVYPPRVPGVVPPSSVNPKIVERTWAQSIEGYTGSAVLRVPWTKEVTWVGRTEEYTNVEKDTVGTTIVGGGTVETTTVGGGTVESKTVGGGTVETTVVGGGTVEATVVGGGTLEAKVTGLAAIEAAVVGGIKAGLEVVGGLAAEISITGGLKFELGIASNSIEVRIGPKIEAATSETVEFEIEKMELHLKKDKVGLLENDVKTMKTELATNKTQINTLYDVLSGQVMLL